MSTPLHGTEVFALRAKIAIPFELALPARDGSENKWRGKRHLLNM